MLKVKNNVVTMDMNNDINLEFVRNSFMEKKLKKIILKWDISFFKLVNLRKHKLRLSKIKLFNNAYGFSFTDIKNLNKMFKLNENIFVKKINILSIINNGYYINYNILKSWKFSNILFEKIYINLLIKLIFGLIIVIFFLLLYKLLNYIRFSFLNYKLNV